MRHDDQLQEIDIKIHNKLTFIVNSNETFTSKDYTLIKYVVERLQANFIEKTSSVNGDLIISIYDISSNAKNKKVNLTSFLFLFIKLISSKKIINLRKYHLLQKAFSNTNVQLNSKRKNENNKLWFKKKESYPSQAKRSGFIEDTELFCCTLYV